MTAPRYSRPTLDEGDRRAAIASWIDHAGRCRRDGETRIARSMITIAKDCRIDLDRYRAEVRQ